MFITSHDGAREEMFFGSDRFHILFPMIGVPWTGPNPKESKMWSGHQSWINIEKVTGNCAQGSMTTQGAWEFGDTLNSSMEIEVLVSKKPKRSLNQTVNCTKVQFLLWHGWWNPHGGNLKQMV